MSGGGGGGKAQGPSLAEQRLWNTQAKIGRGLWQSYKTHGEPILADLSAEARAPISEGLLASRASAAGADVDQSYDAAEANYRGQLGRYGMNPASGRFAGGLRSLALGRAGSKAGAMTTSRRQARAEHDRKRFGVLAATQGQSGQAIGALSNVSHSMGQSRANTNAIRAQRASDRESGFGQLIGTGITAAATIFSDRRMKKDAKKVGETPYGIPIYEFRYKGQKGGPKQVGHMAQDVEKVQPEAVVDVGGMKAIDYSKVFAKLPEHPRTADRRGQKERASLASAHMGRMVSDAAAFVGENLPELPGNLLERKKGGSDRVNAPVMAVPQAASLRAARQSERDRKVAQRRTDMGTGPVITPDGLAAIEQQLTPERLKKWDSLLSDLDPSKRPENLVAMLERKRAEFGMGDDARMMAR